MEAIVVLTLVGVAAVVIYMMVLSSKAKKQRHFTVRIPAGQNVQDIINRAYGSLPSGWAPVGAKKGHDFILGDWESEGKFLDVASGNALTGAYVVSVEMGVSTQDEFGRPVDIPFDQAPPQSEYDAHMWVSYASRGQGRMWPPNRSLSIEKVKDYLERSLV